MIKRVLYNNTPELILLFFGAVMCFLLSLVADKVTVSIVLVCLVISFVWYIRRNRKFNRNRSYLSCNHSIFCKKRVWINQKSFINRKINVCPQKEFVREMSAILKEISDGTICYCCTHELIMKHILKKYPKAEISKAYTKDLRKLKKKIKTNKCDECSTKKCNLLKNDKTQFYSIKFVK